MPIKTSLSKPRFKDFIQNGCFSFLLLGLLLHDTAHGQRAIYGQTPYGQSAGQAGQAGPSAGERLFSDEDSPKANTSSDRKPHLRFDDRLKKNDRLESEDQQDHEEPLLENEEPMYEDFSKYIRETTGKTVLDALPIKRSSVNSPKLPENYALGSGDRIEVQVWGSLSAEYRLTLDGTGRVFVPDVGSIPLNGVKANELTQVISGHFGRIYKGFELRATVDSARATSVFVTGHAKSVGIQTVPATHTLISASLSFARPSQGGSSRFVEFQRKGSPLQRIDLYCFFRNECLRLPEVIQDGDTIRVPPRGKLVAISGAVARPGIYELAEGESSNDLLAYAGGLSVIADPNRIQLYSFSAQKSNDRILRTTSVNKLCAAGNGASASNCTVLTDGDYLDVQSKLTIVRNAISLVAPGVDTIKLEFQPGMRLLDVLRSPFDELMPGGALQAINTGSFTALTELDEKLKGLDLNAVTIYRQDKDKRTFQPIMASYEKASADANGPDNPALMEGDVIVVEDNNEWRGGRDARPMSVRVLGEVAQPGRYRYVGVRTLNDVLKMAGGSTPNAAIWSAVVLRQGDGRNAVGKIALDRALKSVTEYQSRQEQVNSDKPITSVQPRALSERDTGSGLQLVNRRTETEVMNLMRGRDIVYLGSRDGMASGDLVLTPYDIVIIPAQQDTYSCQGAFFRVGEVLASKDSLSLDEAANRCGILDEMKPNLYHFVSRENRICKPGWLRSCPPVQGGDLLVAVPEAVRKQGNALDWLDTTLKTLTAVATLKVLSN